jgi:hypothetical protein
MRWPFLERRRLRTKRYENVAILFIYKSEPFLLSPLKNKICQHRVQRFEEMHKKALNDNKIIYYIIWDLNLPVTFGYIVFAKKKISLKIGMSYFSSQST